MSALRRCAKLDEGQTTKSDANMRQFFPEESAAQEWIDSSNPEIQSPLNFVSCCDTFKQFDFRTILQLPPHRYILGSILVLVHIEFKTHKVEDW